MPTILITGGSGTIGKRLSQLLSQKGYQVIILTRHIPKEKKDNNNDAVKYATWNIDKGEIDNDAIRVSDFIIHLAGAGVAEKRWTEDRKREILNSRTRSSALLVKALKEIPNQVKAVVSASASGYYGSDDLLSLNDGFTEDDKAAHDFLGKVCEEWENAIEPVTDLGKRLVILRTGIVLSKKGGAFTEFLKPFNMGIAAVLGDGKQIVSWIHEDDICNMYIYALEKETMNGPYNAVAPYPVTNKDLIIAIARTRNTFHIRMNVPTFVLRLMLGELSTEVLKSANLSSARIQNEGYRFLYPEIKSAVTDLLRS